MKENWVFLSTVGLVSLSVMSILITSLARKGYPVSFVLLGLGIILTIFYFFQTFVFLSYSPKISIGIVLILILIGILSAVGNWSIFQAANNAPNAGLAIAIGAGMQSALVAILAYIFLKDKLTSIQLIGLVLALISVFIINLGSNSGMEKSQAKTARDSITKNR